MDTESLQYGELHLFCWPNEVLQDGGQMSGRGILCAIGFGRVRIGSPGPAYRKVHRRRRRDVLWRASVLCRGRRNWENVSAGTGTCGSFRDMSRLAD